jgi:hypothetical protein
MNLKKRLLIFTLLLPALAHPIPPTTPPSNPSAPAPNSLTQHLGRAGLLVLTLSGILGLAAGGITYGTHWLHRYKSLTATEEGNMTLWRAEQERRDVEHRKKMEGLDIILDVVRNYTEDLGREREEREGREKGGFDPFLLVGEVERGVEEAQIKEGTSLKGVES